MAVNNVENTSIERLLAHNCFEESGGGAGFTRYENSVQELFLYTEGKWRIFYSGHLDRVVAEGRGADELAQKIVHPRWIDELGFRVR